MPETDSNIGKELEKRYGPGFMRTTFSEETLRALGITPSVENPKTESEVTIDFKAESHSETTG